MNNLLKQTVPASVVIGAFAGIGIGMYFFSAGSLMIGISCGLGAMVGSFVHFMMNKENWTELSRAHHTAKAEIEHKQNAVFLMKAMMYFHFHPSDEEYIDVENVEKWIRTKTDDEIKSWLNSEIGNEQGTPPDTFDEWFDWQSKL